MYLVFYSFAQLVVGDFKVKWDNNIEDEIRVGLPLDDPEIVH